MPRTVLLPARVGSKSTRRTSRATTEPTPMSIRRRHLVLFGLGAGAAGAPPLEAAGGGPTDESALLGDIGDDEDGEFCSGIVVVIAIIV